MKEKQTRTPRTEAQKAIMARATATVKIIGLIDGLDETGKDEIRAYLTKKPAA